MQCVAAVRSPPHHTPTTCLLFDHTDRQPDDPWRMQGYTSTVPHTRDYSLAAAAQALRGVQVLPMPSTNKSTLFSTEQARQQLHECTGNSVQSQLPRVTCPTHNPPWSACVSVFDAGIDTPDGTLSVDRHGLLCTLHWKVHEEEGMHCEAAVGPYYPRNAPTHSNAGTLRVGVLLLLYDSSACTSCLGGEPQGPQSTLRYTHMHTHTYTPIYDDAKHPSITTITTTGF